MQVPADEAFPAPHVDHGRMTKALYISTVFLFWTALYLYLPTLPIYAQSKSESLTVVGVILSMYGLWQAIVRLPLGVAADWLGWRKPFIMVGFALAGLGAWCMGIAENAIELAVGRAITGLAASTWVPLVVAFSSLFPPEETVRASAILTLAGSVGRILATAVNGTFNDLGGYSLSFFLAGGIAVLAILVFLPARERRRPSQPPSLYGIGRLLTRADVLLPSLLSALALYANWTATFGFIPILAGRMGATDVTISVMTSMYFCVATVGNILATATTNRLGARLLVLGSFALLSLGIGMAAIASNLLLVFLAQFCIGLSMGIGYPLMMGMSIQRVADTERTTAMGLHQSLYAIGMFGGPVLSGALADAIGIRPMFGLTALVCLAGGLVGIRRLSEPSGE